MISIQSEYGPCTVVVPSGSLCRYVNFELDLEALKVPHRSKLGRARGSSVAKNRNEPVRLSITPWYLFCDDDQRVSDDLLFNLMKHDKPVVAALICTKMPPFIPIIFKQEAPRNDQGYRMFQPYSWKDLDGKRGLFGPVFGANGGVFLVKREVFEALEYPWFRLGQDNPEDCQEDMYFYDQCRRKGIEVYVDLDTRAGHMSPVTAVPAQFPDGTWSIRLEFENEESVLLGRTDLPAVPSGLPA